MSISTSPASKDALLLMEPQAVTKRRPCPAARDLSYWQLRERALRPEAVTQFGTSLGVAAPWATA